MGQHDVPPIRYGALHCIPLLAIVLALVLAPLAAVAKDGKLDCIRFADHRVLNAMFSEGGPGTKLLLCQGVEYPLTGTIVFTAADQELATAGYPTGDERAILRVASEIVATAVQGDCRRCARVSVRNLVIDGGRPKYGRMGDANNAPGLVVIGGNEGQRVTNCRIRDPRGFTAVHVREGAKLNCKGAIIERNDIGPVGDEYDPILDGPDPESSPLGRPLADGISIACRDSSVRDNILTDCTDAGVVVYCSPGSTISGNRITTSRRSGMGGIFLVDDEPFGGDYSGVVVRDNVLDASKRAMRVGIGLGLSVLSDDNETLLKGGKVVSNHLEGNHMGFGIAAAGLEGWTIQDNWSDARHSGKKSSRCFDDPVNPEPVPFVYNKATVTRSTVQKGFLDRDFAYIVCIDEVEGLGIQPHIPDVPVVVPVTQEPLEEEESEDREPEMSTGNDILDGILLHSQQRMLEAIGHLQDRVNRPVAAKGVEGDTKRAAPQDLSARLARIEATQAGLSKSLKGLHSALRKLTVTVAERGSWETDVLLHIQQQFYGEGEEAVEEDGGAEPQGGAVVPLGYGSGMLSPWWLGGGIVAVAGGVMYRRYRRSKRRSSKIV